MGGGGDHMKFSASENVPKRQDLQKESIYFSASRFSKIVFIQDRCPYHNQNEPK